MHHRDASTIVMVSSCRKPTISRTTTRWWNERRRVRVPLSGIPEVLRIARLQRRSNQRPARSERGALRMRSDRRALGGAERGYRQRQLQRWPSARGRERRMPSRLPVRSGGVMGGRSSRY